MISIRIQDSYLTLYPTTRISLRIYNQIFSDNDFIKGDYSLGFDVPGAEDAPENAALLGNPDVVQQDFVPRRIAATLLLYGAHYENCLITTTKTTPKSYTIALLFGLATIADDFKTKKLRDLLAGQTRTIQGARRRIIYLKPVGSLPYRITVNGQLFESSISLLHLANQISVPSGYVNVVADHVTSTNTSLGVSPPFLQVLARNPANVTEDVTYRNDYELYVDAAEDTATERNKWYVEAEDEDTYHTQVQNFMAPYLTTTPPDEALSFPTVFNNKTYGDELVQDNWVQNAWYNNLAVTNDANYGVTYSKPFVVKNLNTIHPFIRLRWMLDQIADYFQISFEGDFYTDEILNNKLIWNSMPASFAQAFIGKRKYIVHKQSFDLSELVPDISVIDLLKALQARYNLAIYQNPDNKNIVLRRRDAVWKNFFYNDITHLSSPKSEIENQFLAGFSLKSLRDTGDADSVDDVITIGSKVELEIEAKCSGIYSYIFSGIFIGVGFGGAKVSAPIKDKAPLRIFYDAGRLTYLDSTHYRGSNISQAGLPDEKFTGSNGLYEKEYKAYLRSRAKQKEIKLNCSFNLIDLFRIANEVKLRYDRTDYLYREIIADFTMTGLGISEVTLITV